ncbi:MAG: hypothetical protein U0822_00250 [Anaerolineae bacterium]
MALTEQQAAAIERLRGNESLTGNLTDRSATAVLAWAEEQIRANAVYEDVVAAVRAGNRTGAEDVDEVLGAAHKTLAAAQAARGAPSSAPLTESAAAATPAPAAPSPQPAPAEPAAASTAPEAPPSPTQPPTSGQTKRSTRKSSAHRK